jgi:uncharacterized phiE125 gp8 family phage protein
MELAGGWALIIQVKTEPASEPVSTITAKDWLRVDYSDDDVLIESLVRTARVWLEQRTNYSIAQWSYYLGLGGFPRSNEITLPVPPVSSITSLKYWTSGGEQTVNSGDYSLVAFDGLFYALRLNDGVVWPGDSLVFPFVKVDVVTGYALESEVPDPLVTAMRQLVTFWYENRDAAVASTEHRAEVVRIPYGVEELIEGYVWK